MSILDTLESDPVYCDTTKSDVSNKTRYDKETLAELITKNIKLSNITREKAKIYATRNATLKLREDLKNKATGLKFVIQCARENTPIFYDPLYKYSCYDNPGTIPGIGIIDFQRDIDIKTMHAVNAYIKISHDHEDSYSMNFFTGLYEQLQEAHDQMDVLTAHNTQLEKDYKQLNETIYVLSNDIKHLEDSRKL
jgi:hypothetical protein